MIPAATVFSAAMAATGRGCVKTRSKIVIVGQHYTPQQSTANAYSLRTTIVRLIAVLYCTFSTANSVLTF
jgi:hypothetical protein